VCDIVQTGHTVTDYANDTELLEPGWVEVAVDRSVTWLLGRYQKSDYTRNGYATDLGVPRARQVWRPIPTHNRGRRSTDDLQQAFFRWCLAYGIDPFTDLTTELLEAWILFARENGDSDATLRRRYGAVQAWYSAMRRQELTTIVIGDLFDRQERSTLGLVGKKPAKPTIALTLAQVRALAVAAEYDPTDQRERNQAIVGLLPATGLRADELCGLDLDDLHRPGVNGVPEFYVLGKGSKYRWVRCPDAELALIDAYLPVRVAPTVGSEITLPGQVSNRTAVAQPLLTTVTGQRLTPGGLTAILRRLCGLLNPDSDNPRVRAAARELLPLAKKLHLHQIRHFAAREAHRNGALITEIRDWLGHSSITITETYLGLGDPDRSPGVVVSGVIHAGHG
jgi:integrase